MTGKGRSSNDFLFMGLIEDQENPDEIAQNQKPFFG